MLLQRYIAMLLTACSLLFCAGCAEQSLSSEVSAPPQAQQTEEPARPVESAGVTVFAGSAAPGFAEGANATASFVKPYGLCAAPGGGLLVVDCYANLLRVSRDDIVSNLAGNTEVLDQEGIPLASYQNGEAPTAYLNHPRFAVATTQGAVVFSDTGNHRVRILADGVVRLLAGSGTRGYRDGTYQDAQFDTPSGVAVGADGSVYVADTLNHCIRAISPQGVVSTLAGKPQTPGFRDGALEEALFCEPNDIQLAPDGSLYVVDKGNQRIRRIANQTVTTVAGSGDTTDTDTGYIVGGYQDGAAARAQFLYPTGLFAAADGTVYVADTGNNCIRVIAPDGMVSTLAGTRMAGNVSGPVKSARFNQPLDVYRADGVLYVSDSYNHIIRAIELGA